ncbi:IclR family transcriptional regulator [Aerococcaceae bacterium WGS1372]
MSNTPKKPYGTVLIKADQILAVLSNSQDPLPMSDIAQRAELTLSTTSKILDTLILLGYVRRDSTGKRFALGAGILQLATSAFMHFDIVRESYPALKHLHEYFDETVHLGLFQDNQIIYVNKIVSSSKDHQTLSKIGNTQPLYCSAMGKALLSTLDEHKQAQYYDSIELIQRTEQTITNLDELKEQVQTASQLGYAIDDRESEEDVFCVGAAIVNPIDRNYYAFSISLPYNQINDEKVKELIAGVMRTKAIIEFHLESNAS